jgi:hypothetical protein
VGDREGTGEVQKKVVEGNDPHRGHGLVYEGEWWAVFKPTPFPCDTPTFL